MTGSIDRTDIHRKYVASHYQRLREREPAAVTCPNLGMQMRSVAMQCEMVNDVIVQSASGPLHIFTKENILEAGLEPAISSLGGRRLIH